MCFSAYAAFDPVNLVDPWGLGAGPPDTTMDDAEEEGTDDVDDGSLSRELPDHESSVDGTSLVSFQLAVTRVLLESWCLSVV